MSMRVAMLGLMLLGACAGCATGARSTSLGANGQASPSTYDYVRCDGWYNATSGVCDSIGD